MNAECLPKPPTPITLPARGLPRQPSSRASGLAILTAGLLVDVATAAVLGSVGLDHVEMRRAAAAVLGSDR